MLPEPSLMTVEFPPTIRQLPFVTHMQLLYTSLCCLVTGSSVGGSVVSSVVSSVGWSDDAPIFGSSDVSAPGSSVVSAPGSAVVSSVTSSVVSSVTSSVVVVAIVVETEFLAILVVLKFEEAKLCFKILPVFEFFLKALLRVALSQIVSFWLITRLTLLELWKFETKSDLIFFSSWFTMSLIIKILLKYGK